MASYTLDNIPEAKKLKEEDARIRKAYKSMLYGRVYDAISEPTVANPTIVSYNGNYHKIAEEVARELRTKGYVVEVQSDDGYKQDNVLNIKW